MTRYALLGEGIDYTLSPKIHQIISAVTGRACCYDVVDVKQDDLPRALDKLFSDYDGFNVTKPFKQSSLITARLTQPVGQQSAQLGAGRTLGALNTVDTKSRTWENTDYGAFLDALRFAQMCPKKQDRVLVLGAGGAARSAIVALKDCNLTVCNRSLQKAQELCLALGVQATVLDRESVCGEFDLIVNATTLGLQGENCLPQGVTVTAQTHCFDMIYAPTKTVFLEQAEQGGARTQNGGYMLVMQAIAARQFWEQTQITTEQIQLIWEKASCEF